jgi:hypothetical protein
LLEQVFGPNPADVDMLHESDLDLSRTYNPIWVKKRFTDVRGAIRNILLAETVE